MSATQKEKEKRAQAKAVKEEKARQIAEKQEALKTYQAHLAEVQKLKAMTDTEAWQAFYRGLQRQIATHGEAVLSAEKNRDVIHHQEGVKILRGLTVDLQKPIRDLAHYVRETIALPLIAACEDMPYRAEWNAALGKVEIKAITK